MKRKSDLGAVNLFKGKHCHGEHIGKPSRKSAERFRADAVRTILDLFGKSG